MAVSDAFRLAKSKSDPHLKLARDRDPAHELSPGTITHSLDVLRGWLPNIGEEWSSTFRAYKKQEATAKRFRSNEYNRLIANRISPTTAEQAARQLPEYIQGLIDEARLHADHAEVNTYREDVKECINILKAELKSMDSDRIHT